MVFKSAFSNSFGCSNFSGLSKLFCSGHVFRFVPRVCELKYANDRCQEKSLSSGCRHKNASKKEDGRELEVKLFYVTRYEIWFKATLVFSSRWIGPVDFMNRVPAGGKKHINLIWKLIFISLKVQIIRKYMFGFYVKFQASGKIKFFFTLFTFVGFDVLMNCFDMKFEVGTWVKFFFTLVAFVL